MSEQQIVTDITYISTDSGNVFLSIVKDLFDNAIMGYCVSRTNDIKLVAETMGKAFADIRAGNGGPILLHSGQGFQYTSKLYAILMGKYGITSSMSRKATVSTTPQRRTFSVI